MLTFSLKRWWRIFFYATGATRSTPISIHLFFSWISNVIRHQITLLALLRTISPENSRLGMIFFFSPKEEVSFFYISFISRAIKRRRSDTRRAIHQSTSGGPTGLDADYARPEIPLITSLLFFCFWKEHLGGPYRNIFQHWHSLNLKLRGTRKITNISYNNN